MTNINTQIGRRIRELRLAKGITQEQFADECQIHRSHMGEIERGEVNVTATSLQQIGVALQMPLSTLLKGI